jgi:hypothetical protein
LRGKKGGYLKDEVGKIETKNKNNPPGICVKVAVSFFEEHNITTMFKELSKNLDQTKMK